MEDENVSTKEETVPCLIRLPKRYEQFVKEPTCHVHNIKSISTKDEKENDHMLDMIQAMMWVKQELIQLKQHDILLKRQFCDIQDTIKTLSKIRKNRKTVTDSTTSLQSTEGNELGMDNYSVRSASSVTALINTDSDSDEEELARPRTCSMMTTRDLTALARRRGSQEMI